MEVLLEFHVTVVCLVLYSDRRRVLPDGVTPTSNCPQSRQTDVVTCVHVADVVFRVTVTLRERTKKQRIRKQNNTKKKHTKKKRDRENGNMKKTSPTCSTPIFSWRRSPREARTKRCVMSSGTDHGI